MKKLVFSLLIFLINFSYGDEVNIIPKPVHIDYLSNEFFAADTINIAFDSLQCSFWNSDLYNIINDFIEKLDSILDLVIVVNYNKAGKTIKVMGNDIDIDLKSEGYLLTVTEDTIFIKADSVPGVFYGFMTFYQLIDWGKPYIKLQCMNIEDYPNFLWRGMHFDVSRHFFSIDFIKKYIDMMALYKLNKFHWHLTDDHGWRIEIKRYPKLTEIGSYRIEHDTLYGGFYSQNEIKEVIEYAKRKCIEVIPEIEMPGHSLAALASYPQYSCTGGPFSVPTTWGIFKDVYCAGNDSTFMFLENILSEVMELFPSKYIHIGGDEVPKDRWHYCPKCQQRIKDENLADEHELQSYFIKRIENFVNSKGKYIIGWDEILEGGLADNAIVQSWRGINGGIEAANNNHYVIMSPINYLYFNMEENDNSLQHIYNFNPVPPELPIDKVKYILGGEACLWTEYVASNQKAEYQLFPRLLALSEILWTPEESKDYNDFYNRVLYHFNYLSYNDIYFRLFSVPLFSNENGGFLDKFEFINASENSGLYKAYGYRPGSNALLWESNTNSDYTMLYWDVRNYFFWNTILENLELSFYIKVNKPVDTLFIGFVDSDNKRFFTSLDFSDFSSINKWQSYLLKLENWNIKDGFDFSNIDKLAFWYNNKNKNIRIYLSDIWFGKPDKYPKAISPLVFFTGFDYGFGFKTGFFNSHFSSGIQNIPGENGRKAIVWIYKNSNRQSSVLWKFVENADLSEIFRRDTLFLDIKSKKSYESIKVIFVDNEGKKASYLIDKKAFDGIWHSISIPLNSFYFDEGFDIANVQLFKIHNESTIENDSVWITNCWIGHPPSYIVQTGIKESAVNQNFEIFKNYLNPFNNSTTIIFNSNNNTYGVLSIYNILGQMVYNKKIKVQNGINKIKVNLANNPSGIYFYKLDIGDLSKIKKMILLK